MRRARDAAPGHVASSVSGSVELMTQRPLPNHSATAPRGHRVASSRAARDRRIPELVRPSRPARRAHRDRPLHALHGRRARTGTPFSGSVSSPTRSTTRSTRCARCCASAAASARSGRSAARREPADLVDRLLERGLVRDKEPYAVALVLTHAPPPPPPEIVARRVETFEEYAAANAVQWEAFETPADEIEECAREARRAVERDRERHARRLARRRDRRGGNVGAAPSTASCSTAVRPHLAPAAAAPTAPSSTRDGRRRFATARPR